MAPDPARSAPAALGRIYWMMLGPMLLLVLALQIVRIGNGWLTPADLAFLTVLTSLVLVRCWEFRGGAGRTGAGEPATPADLRRYVLGALAVGLVAWVVANVIGNHWPAS